MPRGQSSWLQLKYAHTSQKGAKVLNGAAHPLLDWSFAGKFVLVKLVWATVRSYRCTHYASNTHYPLPTTQYAEDLQYHTPCYSLPSLPSLPSTTTTVTSKVFCIPACLMHEKNIEACRCLCVACYLDSPFSMLLR